MNDPKIGTHSYLELPNQNYKIHYVSNGKKGKPLILFLHGFPEFWYSWRFQLPEFGKDHFAVAIDNLGYGKSSKPTDKESYSFKNIALLIKDIVHELGYEECILVGHDWGTLMACEVASDFPHMVKKLILANGFPFDLNVRSQILKQNPAYMFKAGYAYFFNVPYYPESLLSSKNFGALNLLREGKGAVRNLENFTEEELAAYKYQFQEGGFTGPLNYYRNMYTWETVNRKPQYFEMPVLMIWGTEDTFVTNLGPEVSLSIMKNGRIHNIEGASHWVNVDKPDEVNKAIREFLEEEEQ